MKQNYFCINFGKLHKKNLLLMTLFILGLFQVQAQVRKEFNPRVSTYSESKKIYNVNGDFSILGNTNMTLQNYSVGGINSNSSMIVVDKDNNSSTTNSSMAELKFSDENGASPECTKIVYAGLYWTGRTNSWVTTESKRKIKLKSPGQTYQTVIAEQDQIKYPGDNNMYVAYAEVTSLVQNGGPGEYWAADIALTTGNGGSTGYYGGWGMVVVYENSKMNPRDISVFDGYAYVKGNSTENHEIEVSGFNTAQTGDVNLKIGLMAGEGDGNISGDYFKIKKKSDNQWLNLSHSLNSTNNFFNSSINTTGDRTPDLVNNTGLDISMFNIPNKDNEVIDNNQTSTTFKYGSNQDTYIIYSMAMSVDAYQPKIEGINSIVSVNGDPYTSSSAIEPDQEVTYKIELRNKGTEDLENVKLTIPIPYNGEYVSGSSQTQIYYTPSPSPNTVVYDPSLGATGSLIWNLGDLPETSDNSKILAELYVKIRVTTDCNILKYLECSSESDLVFRGSLNGKGKITGANFENTGLIQGYEATDSCEGEPISRLLSIPINANSYVAENCSSGSETKKFSFCN